MYLYNDDEEIIDPTREEYLASNGLKYRLQLNNPYYADFWVFEEREDCFVYCGKFNVKNWSAIKREDEDRILCNHIEFFLSDRDEEEVRY